MGWTNEQYEEWLVRRFGVELRHPESQRENAPALEPAVPRKTESLSRTRLRITGYRVKPLDPDNFCGGLKDVIDGLRHAALIHGDDPTQIVLETEQVKVGKRSDQKTVVEITYP